MDDMATHDDHMARLRRQLGDVTAVSASEAKNSFGQILDSAIRDGAVVITKHDTPRAILMSVEEYEAIGRAKRLDTLTADFDAAFARMQKLGVGAKMKAAFDASPRDLGAAAVKAARKK